MLQLEKGTAFVEGLSFKSKYPTQKLYNFFSLIIIFINLFFLPLSFVRCNVELIWCGFTFDQSKILFFCLFVCLFVIWLFL